MQAKLPAQSEWVHLQYDTALILEKKLLDLGAYIRQAKEAWGYKKIVLVCGSGGGARWSRIKPGGRVGGQGGAVCDGAPTIAPGGSASPWPANSF